MAALVLIFWALAALAFLTVFLLFAGFFAVGVMKKQRQLIWIAGPFTAVLLIFGVVVGMFVVPGIVAVFHPPSPERVFKGTFGEQPTAEIRNLQADYYCFADCCSVYVRFESSEAEFRRLANENLIETRVPASPCFTDTSQPEWWFTDLEPSWIYYTKSPKGTSGDRAYWGPCEYYAYARAEGVAYYRFIDID